MSWSRLYTVKRESSDTEPLGWTPEPGNGAVKVKGQILSLGWVRWDLGNRDR